MQFILISHYLGIYLFIYNRYTSTIKTDKSFNFNKLVYLTIQLSYVQETKFILKYHIQRA